ncbi:MAG: ABC transporter permease [Gemmatimonadota bacterium]
MKSPRPELDRRSALWLDYVARIVPAELRADWLREWTSELWYSASTASDTGARSPSLRALIGALPHACYLRSQTFRMATLRRDVAFAVRSYRRSPGYSASTIVTLALASAGLTAVLTIVDGALLRPYPYGDADRMVELAATDPERPGEALRLSFPEVQALEQSPAFASVTAFDWEPFNARQGERTEWVGANRVTASVFTTFGLEPLAGRGFRPEDGIVGGPDVVVLSTAMANRAGAPQGVVGSVVSLDGVPYEVVGVAPPEMAGPDGPDLWVPLRPTGTAASVQSRWLTAYGRLADGVSPEQAHAALESLRSGLAEQAPEDYENRGFQLRSLRDARASEVRTPLLGLVAVLGLVYLIVVANLAVLTAARAGLRGHEFAVRTSLGAGRDQLRRQLIVEGFVLGGVAALIGAIGAHWLLGVLSGAVPESPEWFSTRANSWIFAGVAAALVATGVGVTLLAHRTGSGPSPARALRGQARGVPRDALVLTQIAMTTLLVLGTGSLGLSLRTLSDVQPGFDATDRVAGTIQLPTSRYDTDASVIAFFDEVSERVRSSDPRSDVGAVTRLPFRSGVNNVLWWEDGQSEDAFRTNPAAELNSVSEAYFATMGIPLLRGRPMESSDDGRAEDVVWINESLAAGYFGTRNPIGALLSYQYPPRFARVAGVVADVHQQGLDQVPPYQLYAPYRQRPTTRVSLVVSLPDRADVAADALRSSVAEVDPDLAIANLSYLSDSIHRSLWALRFATTLLVACGMFALVLAGIGVSGVLSQAVTHRRKEIGIRFALGAPAPSVARLIGRRLGAVVTLGLSIGIVAALLVGRLAERTVYGFAEQSVAEQLAPLALVLVTGLLAAAPSLLRVLRTEASSVLN